MPTLTGNEVLEVQGTFAGGKPSGDTFLCSTQDIADLGGGGGGSVTSVTGTANRITIGGTATDPIVDISASYVGQASITTLGTIGTGVWQGTAVAGQYGGTGVANTGKTITIGGNFTTSGAFTTTLTVTANTGVTLPTTGTLATLAGAEALTNKSVNGVTLTTGGSATQYLNGAGSYVSITAGDFSGPASSTNNAVVLFSGTGGKTGQNSVVTIDPATGATAGIGTLAAGVTTITATSATAFAVGATGATNPGLLVNTASGSSGLSITTGAGTTVAAIGSGSDISLSIASKGNAAVQLSSSGGTMTFSSDNQHIFQNFGSSIVVFTGSTASFAPRTSSTASSPRFGFTGAANTTLTASADFNNVYFNMGQTNQHATGAITTQRDFRITPMTHSAVGASVITDAYSFYVDSAPVASTNVTITNPWAVGMGGKLLVNSTDATTAITTFQQVAGGSYIGLDWTATATTGVRFSVIGYGKHSGNGDITSTGHVGGILGFAQKTGTGTDALVIGVEGRVGAVTGTITTGAAVTATFDTNTEDAGTFTNAVGFYVPDQTDAGHITNKYSFLSVSSDWELRNNGPSTLFGKISQDTTITPPGTTGARTINKPTGKVNFAAAATSLVVTNSLCTANSIVFCVLQSIDASMVSAYAVPDAGFFTIVAVGTPAAECKVAFQVIN